MPSVRLFVYGSLKRGALHHGELGGARFLGEAETAPGYSLTALGPYWALIATPDSGSVVPGELFEVPDVRLPALDEFEGEGYARGAVFVRRLHPGEKEVADADGVGAATDQSESFRGFFEALAYLRKSR